MDIESLVDLQNQIVVDSIKGIEDEWDIAVFNVEIKECDEDIGTNCLAFSFVKREGAWVRSGFRLPIGCSELFERLRESSEGAKWSICTLEVTSEGQYEFTYSYDTPLRSNGIIDDKSMLKGYVPTLLP